MSNLELGIHQVATHIHEKLQQYIESMYLIKDQSVVAERKLMLETTNTISQKPYVEVTPTYKVYSDFKHLAIDPMIKNLLQDLSQVHPNIGVYPPYMHQSQALEAFFRDHQDLVVATGTGSGKTETFLYSMIGHFASEAKRSAVSFQKKAMRAMILYPMNALVNDQTSRLRKMFGNENFVTKFKQDFGRQITFGMYTSRTPYPGIEIDEKNQKNIKHILDYYLKIQKNGPAILEQELKNKGKWPAKDLDKYLNTGFKTDPNDVELFSRHEIQATPPDILITNYSMLEYMMLRPIERTIFNETKNWLAEDENNEFILILDEAHMYRGVGGAEVAFLIRRLMSRLGVERDRFRCILTSASMGSIENADLFASDLTGALSKRSFKLITSTLEDLPSTSQTYTKNHIEALCQINPAILAASSIHPDALETHLNPHLVKLQCPEINDFKNQPMSNRQKIGQYLIHFQPILDVIKISASNATAFDELAKTIFPSEEEAVAQNALNGLLALANFARRPEESRQNQPILPTRVHLLFRGLTGLYACINSKCPHRLDQTQRTHLLGKLYASHRIFCDCGSRVYELYAHRDCGSLYLHVFNKNNSDFFWNEPSKSKQKDDFEEKFLLVDTPQKEKVLKTHKNTKPTKKTYQINIQTGKVVLNDDYPSIRVYESLNNKCPCCKIRLQKGAYLSLGNFQTKGEAPFSQLVKAQFNEQLSVKARTEDCPNEGKKVLIFSDGRQKAARLARDLPKEVEKDTFREALILALDLYYKIFNSNRDRSISLSDQGEMYLYICFLLICMKNYLVFFEKNDREKLVQDLKKIKDYIAINQIHTIEALVQDDIRDMVNEFNEINKAYRLALLKELRDPYFSLMSAKLIEITLTDRALASLQKKIGSIAINDLNSITIQFIKIMLSNACFDPNINYYERIKVLPFFENVKQSEFNDLIDSLSRISKLTTDQLKNMTLTILSDFIEENIETGYILNTKKLKIKIIMDENCFYCKDCGHFQYDHYFGVCENCESDSREVCTPNDIYWKSNKDYLRKPIQEVLNNHRIPRHIHTEEHTAQLSHRDRLDQFSTTEEFELKFQDIQIDEYPPVDILSCTTTMEVGIDIGSLTAVALRNVPPQRENYQQRAGRSGRRGSSISTVLTFAQGGEHDHYYFTHPEKMISGESRKPKINIDNLKVAKRHIAAYLLQRFFHENPNEGAIHIINFKNNLLSTMGTFDHFFNETTKVKGFSFSDFKEWLKNHACQNHAHEIAVIMKWLPNDLIIDHNQKLILIQNIIQELIIQLEKIKQYNEKDKGLLDVFFDHGILPAYAFPIDVASFIIEKAPNHKEEVAQQNKIQALNEYAPGKLIVINKKTYRSGGIVCDEFSVGQQGNRSIAHLFKNSSKYIACSYCTYTEIKKASDTSEDHTECPLCKSPIDVLDLLDPPNFSPEKGTELDERDQDQEYSYASSARLPELANSESFNWQKISNSIQYVFSKQNENIRLVVANKGNETSKYKGFTLCQSCGAIWLGKQPNQNKHFYPYKVYKSNFPRECTNHDIKENVVLGHEFQTDLLLLRFEFDDQIDFSYENAWLQDALTTLGQAICLSASRYLDIDFNELASGYRFSKDISGKNLADIYLYDTSPGGSGYASDAGDDIKNILLETINLLKDCPENCDQSCTKCLRNYHNRFDHARLDRHLALNLLEYMLNQKLPELYDLQKQKEVLSTLKTYLLLEGWHELKDDHQIHQLLTLSYYSHTNPKVFFVYHHLLKKDIVYQQIQKKYPDVDQKELVLVSDYMIKRDLPSLYYQLFS